MGFPSNLYAIWKPGGEVRLRPNLERMLIDPKLGAWSMVDQSEHKKKAWTSHCQGVACDGLFWYISHDRYYGAGSKKIGGDEHGVYKFSLDFSSQSKPWILKVPKKHVGDVDCGIYDGEDCVFVPIEDEESSPSRGNVIVLDRDLNVIASADLKGDDGGPPPTHEKAPWFAHNQGNGLLYTSVYDKAVKLEAFDPEDSFQNVPSQSIPLDRVVTASSKISSSDKVMS